MTKFYPADMNVPNNLLCKSLRFHENEYFHFEIKKLIFLIWINFNVQVLAENLMFQNIN